MSGKQYPRLMAREKFATPSEQARTGPLDSARTGPLDSARTGDPESRTGEPMADEPSKNDPPQDPPKSDDPPKDPPKKDEPIDEPANDDRPDIDKIKADARKSDNRAKQARAALEAAEQEKKAADEAREAAEAKNAEILETIAKGLGIKQDDAPPDPEQLKRALSDRDRDLKAKDDVIAAKDQEIADLKAERDSSVAVKDVELAAWREATKQGVNAPMLLNLRSTERALAALDHGADDFADKLSELIKNEAKDNPALLIKAAATAADAGLGGATGSGDNASSAAPGLGRLKAAYATTP